MPSIITHDIFAKEVYKRLDKNIQDKFNKDLVIYNTFAQSHDYLFYYKTPNISKSRRINFLGRIGHRRKTQDYIINIIKNIKKYHLENYQADIAYLFGSITHYVLDSTCHPFIFYKTGLYDKRFKNLKKYKGLHHLMERTIDSLYYKKYYKEDYINCNVSKDIIGTPHLSIDLLTLINMVYEETYNVKNVGLYYKNSIKCAKRIYSLFINDKHNIKRRLYSIIDKVSHNRAGYLAYYTTSFIPNNDYLNINHKIWNHPCDINKTYTYSFDDLFEISIKKCLVIFNKVYDVLYNNKEIDTLKKVIPNISYATGLEIDKNKRMEFFAF